MNREGLALEAGRAVAEATRSCPHPAARALAVVVVPNGRGTMALCLACKRGFEQLGRDVLADRIGPREVVARVVEMGYSRRDGAAFVLGVYARKLRVRLGFCEAA